jgi:hypothetical protein
MGSAYRLRQHGMSTQDRALLFNSLRISMVGHGWCQASAFGTVGGSVI